MSVGQQDRGWKGGGESDITSLRFKHATGPGAQDDDVCNNKVLLRLLPSISCPGGFRPSSP